jgi:osmotically inducible protein OsmC
MPTNSATAEWKGNLTEGAGHIASRTGVIDAPYSLKSRAEETSFTNPEELMAAAHAGCYSMFLSALLAGTQFTATDIKTTSHVTFDKVGEGFAVTGIKLAVEAEIPGISEAEFMALATKAKDECPVSKALSSVPMTLEARLTAPA